MQEQTVPVSLEYKIHTLCSNFNVKNFWVPTFGLDNIHKIFGTAVSLCLHIVGANLHIYDPPVNMVINAVALFPSYYMCSCSI